MPNLKPKQIRQILERYPNELAADIANDFGLARSSIYAVAKRYSVKKSEQFLASEKSGQIKKGEHRSPETELKPGQWIDRTRKPKRINPMIWQKGSKGPRVAKDGDIRYRTNGWRIRIYENNWEFYNRWLWKQHHGEIPKGYNVVSKHTIRSTRMPTIEDLECISDAELGMRNRHTQYPYEIRKTIEFRNKLNKTLKEIENE